MIPLFLLACSEYSYYKTENPELDTGGTNEETNADTTEPIDLSTLSDKPNSLIQSCHELDGTVAPTSVSDNSIPDNSEERLDDYRESINWDFNRVHGLSIEDLESFTGHLHYVASTNDSGNFTNIIADILIVPGDKQKEFLANKASEYATADDFPAMRLGALQCTLVGDVLTETSEYSAEKGFYLNSSFTLPFPQQDLYDFRPENAVVGVGTTAANEGSGMTIDYVAPNGTVSPTEYFTDQYDVDAGLMLGGSASEDVMKLVLALTGGAPTLIVEAGAINYLEEHGDLDIFFYYDAAQASLTIFYSS